MGEAKRRRAAGYIPPRRQEPARGPVLTIFIGLAAVLSVMLVIAVAGVLLSAWSPARAHSFYPWECCSSQDCWPMGRDADAREPDPLPTASGWLLQDGSFVPYAATRPSPDGRFHVCRRGAQRSGEIITPYTQPPCLWAPVPAG